MADLGKSLAWRAFSVPKGGHSREEYEDAAAGDTAAGRFAIADGASESSFAGTWADLLVKGFTEHPGPWHRWLAAARRTWHETFQAREFSWYAEAKFLEGAHATFLGISFQGSDFRSWQAAAVGDCCLFQMRNQRLLRSFPMRYADAFGNQPDVIGSRKSSMKVKRIKCKGDWQKEDEMFLMTDALAQYFLKKKENRQNPAKEILSLQSAEAFEAWITKGRQDGDLRNDDVTLMVINKEEEG
jgi:hypothetical protein